jgi:hypothetical protein
LEKFLIDTTKPILRPDLKADQQWKLNELKHDLSCEGKIQGFVGLSFEKLETVKSRVSGFYKDIVVGRSDEVKRIVHFKAPEKNYYLDYDKLSLEKYNKLRELPWIKRLVFVIESNENYLTDILDKPLPAKFLEVFNKESEQKFHIQINLGLLDSGLGKTINDD